MKNFPFFMVCLFSSLPLSHLYAQTNQDPIEKVRTSISTRPSVLLLLNTLKSEASADKVIMQFEADENVDLASYDLTTCIEVGSDDILQYVDKIITQSLPLPLDSLQLAQARKDLADVVVNSNYLRCERTQPQGLGAIHHRGYFGIEKPYFIEFTSYIKP